MWKKVERQRGEKEAGNEVGNKDPYLISLLTINWEINWELPKTVGSGTQDAPLGVVTQRIQWCLNCLQLVGNCKETIAIPIGESGLEDFEV